MKLMQNNTFGGKEQNYFVNVNSACEMTQEDKQPEIMKVPDEPYIPSWRAACDAWVTQKVEDKAGVHTPVYLLYNAYIKDNPDDYMDIGQFGKVLRSRFPYRKRRRGKQGQQVYVYQDVALKQEDGPSEDVGTVSGEKSSTLMEIGSGASIVVGNIGGGRLLPSPKASEESAEAASVHRASPNKPKISFGDDYEKQFPKADPGQSSSGDEKYGNTSLCRMAVGRRWIDANLGYMPGHDTSADEVLQAYLKDHPMEPLTYTSLALLIRGKYPGRRKKVTVGNATKYVYKDLKLNKTLKDESSINETDSENLSNSSFVPGKSLSVHGVTTKTAELRSSSPSLMHSEQQMYHNSPKASAGSFTYLVSDKNKLEDLQINALRPSVITGYYPSTSYQAPAGIDLSMKAAAQSKTPKLGRMFTDHKHRHLLKHKFIKKGALLSGNEVIRSPSTSNVRYGGNSKDLYKSMTTEVTKSEDDMNVNEYLENELLDINDLNKRGPNYSVSIQVPTQGQVTIPQINPSFRQGSSIILSEDSSYRGKAKINPMLSKHPKYRKLCTIESDVKTLHSGSEGGSSSHLSSPPPPLTSPLIPVVVSDMTREYRGGRKRSWELAAQESGIPEPYVSWDYGLRKSVSPELPRSWGHGVLEMSDETYSSDSREQSDDSRVQYLPMDEIETNLQTHPNFHEKRIVSSSSSSDEAAFKGISTPMNSLSITENRHSTTSAFKGTCGSPTSSSPPGAAMHRLAEEIVTSSPQVGEPSRLSAVCSSSATQEKTKWSVNMQDSHFKDSIKSVISAAKEIPMASGQPIEATLIMRKMENAVIKENPAVLYDELQTCESFSCNCTSALKDLEHSSPEHIIELIRHHQSCSGLGCTPECQTLRAAYVHLMIFRHKCSIWASFHKIIAKHSRRCRILSCDIEFCHFVKHELHLNGVSVLPIQLLKERPSLEEAFRTCEEIGPHDGELHCGHFSVPILPFFRSPARQLGDGQSCRENQQSSVLSQTIVSAFPDTPAGNAVGMHVVKTLNLLRDLFKKCPDVR